MAVADGGRPPRRPVARSALAQFRDSGDAWWQTAISRIEPNAIEIRGYAVQELMGRLSFTDVIALLVTGRLLSAGERDLLDAALVAGSDHGPRAPSIAAARMAATCGVTFNSAVATGINMLGDHHGGAVEGFMVVLSDLADPELSDDERRHAAGQLVAGFRERREQVPGFGHQLHDRDPRRARMIELLEEAVAGGVIRGRYLAPALSLEAALAEAVGREIPLNVDGLTGIVYLELGFPAEVAKGLFSLSRGAGIVAHALEERLAGARIKGPCPPGDELVRYVGEAPRSLVPPPPKTETSNEREFWSTFGEEGLCVFWGLSRKGLEQLDPVTRRRLIGFTNDVAAGAEEDRESLLAELAGLADDDRADALRRLVAS
jgi:citrate synthase